MKTRPTHQRNVTSKLESYPRIGVSFRTNIGVVIQNKPGVLDSHNKMRRGEGRTTLSGAVAQNKQNINGDNLYRGETYWNGVID